MAGRKLTREAGMRLDAYGEDRIFELYLKNRTVRKLLANLPQEVGSMSSAPFYAWLKADATQGRWNRWQDVKAMIASDLVEESLNIADEAEERSVPSARLRVEQRRWMAERYDRSAFGEPDSTTVIGVSIGEEWLASLKRVEEWAKAKKEAKAKAEPEQIPEPEVGEADYEIVEEDEEPSPPSSNPPVPNPYMTTKKRLSRGG